MKMIKPQDLKCLFGRHKQYVWARAKNRKSYICLCNWCGKKHPNVPVLKIRTYKAGYELRDEYVSMSVGGRVQLEGPLTVNPKDHFVMQSAYTLDGNYIGDKRDAYKLCIKRGIKPEKITPTSNTCSIGFSERDQKWYGWSHRAIFGFGIGHTVKKGDCNYKPKNIEEELELLIKWHSEEDRINVKAEVIGDEIHVSWEFTGDKAQRNDLIVGQTYQISDIQFGRGEWTAQTLEDCKEMAIAFAEDVS